STSHEQISSQTPLKTRHSHSKLHRNIKSNEIDDQWIFNPLHTKPQHQPDLVPVMSHNNRYYDRSLSGLDVAMRKSQSKSRRHLENRAELDIDAGSSVFARSVSAHPILMNTPQLPPKIYK
ncbi:unnamed protein product, partial [Schistosoma turkestanicum]